MVSQAIILAAGRGSRLGGTTRNMPKCMLDIGGQSLIEHHVEALHDVGVDDIVVVTGYCDEVVRSRLNGDCRYVHNEKYMNTNSLYSLWLARDEMASDFFLLNCDVLADPQVFDRMAHTEGNALAYDSASGGDDEHMKVQIEDSALVGISKDMPPHQSCGENVGILRISDDGRDPLFDACDEIIGSGQVKAWAPHAVGRLAREQSVQCVDIVDLPWIEIDFEQDLAEARGRVWPAIVRNQTAAARRAV